MICSSVILTQLTSSHIQSSIVKGANINSKNYYQIMGYLLQVHLLRKISLEKKIS